MEGHDDEDHDNHVWRDTVAVTDSSPSTISQSPQSNRSYRTPSPAGDFGFYPDHSAHSFSWSEPGSAPSPLAHPNRSFPAEPLVLTQSLDPHARNGVVLDHIPHDHDDAIAADESQRHESVGSFNRRKLKPDLTTRKRAAATISHGVAKRVLLGVRVCGLALCLVSFSVMAANRSQGWALDSFYRYGEFKYCLGVNVVGFVYLGFQVFDLIHFVTAEKHFINHALRSYSDFFIDQALAYLLVSASSSAATRVDDWQSNWGKDKFPDMARTSVGFSFAAFVAVACSSVISGYILFTNKPF